MFLCLNGSKSLQSCSNKTPSTKCSAVHILLAMSCVVCVTFLQLCSLRNQKTSLSREVFTGTGFYGGNILICQRRGLFREAEYFSLKTWLSPGLQRFIIQIFWLDCHSFSWSTVWSIKCQNFQSPEWQQVLPDETKIQKIFNSKSLNVQKEDWTSVFFG